MKTTSKVLTLLLCAALSLSAGCSSSNSHKNSRNESRVTRDDSSSKNSSSEADDDSDDDSSDMEDDSEASSSSLDSEEDIPEDDDDEDVPSSEYDGYLGDKIIDFGYSFSYGGHEYALLLAQNHCNGQMAEEWVNWSLAYGIFREYDDAYLAAIDTAEENQAILAEMKKNDIYCAYFGLNDAFADNLWVNSNGAQITYTNFAAGEPDGSITEDRAAIFYSNGEWIDGHIDWIGDDDNSYFVVELVPKGASPVTAGTPVNTTKITDGTHDENWNVWVDDEAVAFTYYDSTKLTVSSGLTGFEEWSIQPKFENLTFYSGCTYRVSFDYSFETTCFDHVLTVSAQHNGGEYDTYGVNAIREGQNKHGSLVFTMKDTDYDCFIGFNLGAVPGDNIDFTLTNLVIEELY